MPSITPTVDEKISHFDSLFHGLRNVYGTFDPEKGNHWQIKQKVNRRSIYNHLVGKWPYGFYPLVGDKTVVGVADFDNGNPEYSLEFIQRAAYYDLDVYLERSKSKGYHVWMFFSQEGILTRKVRTIIKQILHDIDAP